MRTQVILAVLLFTMACSSREAVRRGGITKDEPHAPDLTTYTLRLEAATGSRAGASVETGLVLRPFARRPGSSEEVGYGYLLGDISGVGAPLCGDEVSPTSTNEFEPGVILRKATDGRFSLTVGNVSNVYQSSTVVSDGCGIELRIERQSGEGFSGAWFAAGIVHDGSGTYSAVVRR